MTRAYHDADRDVGKADATGADRDVDRDARSSRRDLDGEEDRDDLDVTRGDREVC